MTKARNKTPAPAAKAQFLRATVDAFFAAEQWPVQWLANGVMCSAPFEGRNGNWDLVLHVREPERQLIAYSACPLTVPAGRIAAMGEFITRANFGLVLGCFELGWDDGELRFRTSVDFDDIAPDAAMLRPLVYANALIMDQYLPGIAAVMGGVPATDALLQCELPDLVERAEPQTTETPTRRKRG